jgi:hypothetical protein
LECCQLACQQGLLLLQGLQDSCCVSCLLLVLLL